MSTLSVRALFGAELHGRSSVVLAWRQSALLASPSRSPSGPLHVLLGEREGLHLRKGRHVEAAKLAAEPGLLEAAKGRLGQVGVLVDPDRAGEQLGGERVASRKVAGPDRAAESILRVVCTRDGLLVGLVRRDWHHRPKLLLVKEPDALLDVGDDGGLVEEAPRPLAPASAAQNLAALRPCVLHQRAHLVQLHLVVERAVLDANLEAVPERCLLGAPHELVLELVEDVLVHEAALHRAADLARVVEGAAEDLGRHRLDVDVLAHDRRVVAAHLEGDTLDVRRARAHDLLAGGDGPCEGNLAHAGVAGQVCADVEALLVVSSHDVEHAGRQSRLQDLAHTQRGERREGRRLPDDGVAEHDRGRELGDRAENRKVPRRDGRDDADRLAHHLDPARGGVRVDLGRHGQLDRLLHQPRRPRNLPLCTRERLALLANEKVGQLVAVLVVGLLHLRHRQLPLG
mmetsp:Transcript_49316/g.151700  ORF Transcript_49316/g.151700 Transcript_49316/m.151700 type:complete len:457 (+) Transcript_49316:120-1490(+)